MRQTISVKFFARKDRAKDDGLVPVFMRIGIGLKLEIPRNVTTFFRGKLTT